MVFKEIERAKQRTKKVKTERSEGKIGSMTN